ncbi:MAG: hypothetical protein C5S49_03210 [Candidatus Methanogaster sp.]|nr:MAG: hypothetical protein C5S49_03210 [ANME-2 cluster archaeon]
MWVCSYVALSRLVMLAGGVISVTTIVHAFVPDVPFAFVAFTETMQVPLTLQLAV